jgi:transposase-like protein
VTHERGRPRLYSPELADQICAAIATSTLGLSAIAKECGISPETIYSWLRTNPEFSERYARCKDEQLQILADQILELADTDRVCKKVTVKTVGELETREVTTFDPVERTKIQIDARKWLLSKLAPKRYGDRVGLEHSGKVDLVSSLKGLSDEELLAIATKLSGPTSITSSDPEGDSESKES